MKKFRKSEIFYQKN